MIARYVVLQSAAARIDWVHKRISSVFPKMKANYCVRNHLDGEVRTYNLFSIHSTRYGGCDGAARDD